MSIPFIVARALKQPSPLPSEFAAKLSGNQNLTANNWAQIAFDTERFDHGADFSTVTAYWTPPAANVFLFHTLYLNNAYHTWHDITKNGVACQNGYIAQQNTTYPQSSSSCSAAAANGTDYFGASAMSSNNESLNAATQIAGFTLDHDEIGFSAHLNGSQSFTKALTYVLPATIEDFDQGGYYDAANARWTPPAGPVLLWSMISRPILGNQWLDLGIYKNGVEIATNYYSEGGTQANVMVMAGDQANGTDYYEAKIVSWNADYVLAGDSRFMGLAL